MGLGSIGVQRESTQMFVYKQSSLVFDLIAFVIDEYVRQAGANARASRSPVQLCGARGAWKCRSPTGGAANGNP